MNVSRLLLRSLLGRRLPLTRGLLALPGLDREIAIRRDGWGVPHITASTEGDAWYALGFCQGQDRAFQLESLLRVVRGTLAELVGPEALPIDRLSRRIGFLPAARQQLLVLRPDLLALTEAFARGVTAGATAGMRRPAHEFTLLRSRPTPWTAADALGYVKLTSFLLATNWDVELARFHILQEDGPEALEALDPAYPEWQPVISPPGALAGPAAQRLAAEASALMQVSHGGGGSNNWSLASTRTATGRPILANDPHLAPSLPPHWYLAHITTPDWSAAGASFVGGPGIIVGHNGFAAWGVTVGMTDNTDLFLEKIGPDGRSVRQGDGFISCDVRTERIAVKGQPDVIEEVLVTPLGPIISPALEGEPGAISLRAVWLDRLPVEGFLQLHRIRSFAEFRAALGQWPLLPLNVAYADQSGTIGWQLTGNAPRRRKGHGAVPLPGWDEEAGWEAELVPAAEMPSVENPETGFVATANNKVHAGGADPFLTVDWLDGYRAGRIVELLQERTDWDLPATSRLQLDQQSVPWREMRDIVLRVQSREPAVQQALDLLREWDGRVAADSVGAAIFELFLAEMCTRVARAKAPHSYRWALGQGFHPLIQGNAFAARRVGHLVRLLREQPAGWFEGRWDDEIVAALAAVIRRLQADHGRDRDAWTWGRIRPLMLIHPFGRRKPFDRVFNLGPIPFGGDANTPAQAAARPLDPTGNPTFIASLRMVADVGAWDNSTFILPGGQSGNPFSPHYGDQLPLWQRGESIPIPWSDAAVEAAAQDNLQLLPINSPFG